MGLRAALGDWIEEVGRDLWRARLPLSLRAELIAGVMSRSAGSAAMRRMANGVAAGGTRALLSDPVTAHALIAALQARGARPILIVGDSHSRLYVHRDRRGGRWLLPLHRLATGASARGLAKASSRSGQGDVVRALVERLATGSASIPVLLVFGQVDVEFVFTFKRLEQDPPADHDARVFEDFCRETVDAYVTFAGGLPGPPVAVAAIFPPALSDEAWRQGYLNAHIAHEHTALGAEALRERLQAARVEPLKARTADHELFNRRLRCAAEARGLGWVDTFAALIGEGGVARGLGPAAGRDHHLDASAVRPAVVPQLWALLDASPQTRPAHG